MTEPLSIALVGCGAAARRYYVQALKKCSARLKNLYLVDRSHDLARQMASEIGRGDALADLSEIKEKLDGAIVVVPNHLHYDIARRFIDQGVHVLCEKPLTENGAQAKDLVEAAAAKGVVLCVNNTRRMFPAFQRIRELISAGGIGRLKSISYVEGNVFNWNSETGFSVNPALGAHGLLSDVGPHVIDLICWWVGGKPEILEYEDDSFGGPESMVKLSAMADGCKIDVFMNRLNELKNQFEITGEKGRIIGTQYDWKRFKLAASDGSEKTISLKSSVNTYPEFVEPIVANFLAAIEGSEQPLISGREVADSIAIIDECYQRRKRFAMPIYEQSIRIGGSTARTLVTGATGFIGGRIVELLHLSQDREPVAALHQWGTAARIGRFPVAMQRLDLMNSESIQKALGGVEEIVHCAKGSPEVTVQGTRNLLEAARKSSVRRVVYLSTAEVYGNASGTIEENAPLQYTGDPYNRMKVDAEKVCWEAIEKGLPVVILRPSIVYGPFSKNWTERFARLMLEGRWGLFANHGEGRCNLIYVDDLVKAIALALENQAAAGQAFNMVGPEVGTWNEYFTQFNAKLGLPPLKRIETAQVMSRSALIEPIRVAGRIVQEHFMEPIRFLADRVELVKAILKKTEAAVKATPSPGEYQLFDKTAVLSSVKARQLLKFEPKFNLESGLAATVDWLRQQGVLPV